MDEYDDEGLGPDDEAPVEQFDPEMRKHVGKPWFEHAVDMITSAAELLTDNGVDAGTVFGGIGRLSIDDPLAGALYQVEHLPRTEMGFVVVRIPDDGSILDYSKTVKELSDGIRAANPDAALLVLPADWSFRTMQPDMARSFAENMLAFVSDTELENIGLRRLDAEPG